MPSAQTHPRSGREEGCDFGVLRASVAPQKSQNRGQASGSAPALTLRTQGLQIRGAETTS